MSHTECILLALAIGFVIAWLCCTWGRDQAYCDGYRDGMKGHDMDDFV